MMGVPPEGLRNDLLEPGLDFVDGPAGREAGAVGHPKDMRVDGERLFAEGGVEHHVGGLATDPG